ncbi:MAG: hypothetical protein M3406_00655 [Chloroflexota bacterium]|nr:hypothetical protein [Chloroflexota bacterium]
MKHFLAAAVLAAVVVVAGCTSPENEGGTPLPSSRSEPALYEEGVGPSEDQGELDEGGDDSAP